MISRRMTVVLVIALLFAMAVPCLPSADADDTLSQDDVVVKTGDGLQSIDLTMYSGETTTVTIFVTNNSDKNLNINVSDVSGSKVSSSSSIKIGDSSGSLLGPSGSGRNIAEITVTFSVDRLSDNLRFEGDIVLTIVDVSSQTEDDVIQISVPVTIGVTSYFAPGDAYNKFFGILPNTLPDPLNSPWVTAIVTMVAWILATIVVCHIFIPLFGRIVGSRKTPEEKKVLTKTLTKTVSLLMFIVAVNECFSILGANSEIMSMLSTLSTVLYVLVGAMICWQIYVFLITAIIKGIDDTIEVEGVDTSLIPLFKMLGKLLISVVGVAIILSAFGVDLAGIMVSAGVVTLGITFGAQQMLNQFFSGIVLLSTRPFKKRDFVKIGTETYIVRKVRLMFTEFDNWDMDQIVTIPNNVVTSGTIVNFTRDTSNTRIFIYVTIAYDANLTLAKELMIKAAKMHPHVVKDGTCTPPGTRLTNFQASGIEYRLACFVDDYDNSAHYAGQIREIIYKLFLDNGIEIPYNRLQLDVLSTCDGKRRPDDTDD